MYRKLHLSNIPKTFTESNPMLDLKASLNHFEGVFSYFLITKEILKISERNDK